MNQTSTENSGRLCLWALHFALRRRRALAAVLGTMLLKIGLDVLKPWPMKWLVDYVLGQEPLPEELARAVAWLPGSGTPPYLLAWCVIATIVLFLFGWVLGLAMAWATISLAQRMVCDLASQLFGHLQRLSLRFHCRKPVGDSIRRVTSDCGCIAVIVRDALLPVSVALISLAAMVVIMWGLNPLLTMLALAVVPFMIVALRRYAGPMLERSYEQQEIDGRMYGLIEETLSAIPVVQAFGREEDNDRRFRDSTAASVRAALAGSSVHLIFKVSMGLATTIGTAAILWVGSTQVLDGELTVGSILVFLSYLGSLYTPLETLMFSSTTVQGAAGAARRVREIFDIDHEIADRPGALALARVGGRVHIDHVTFGYETGQAVLHDVSLEASPGQTVALVGETGAGKTTLVSLVPRLFDPWQGRVLIDGHDVRDVRIQCVRKQVALVLQEPFLFPLSIAENIAYGRPDAARDEIVMAARAANAHGFIERLARGYDTVVGERGATLSGGERQRISIARAFLKDAPILILDEPTSALDAETEGLLLEALDRLMRGRTTLIIAHRLSTIRNADRIVVLQKGRVAEAGSHRELLAVDGPYRHFHSMQWNAPAHQENDDVVVQTQ